MTPSRITDIAEGVVMIALVAAVIAGAGEQRNHYHYMRGYMAALRDVLGEGPKQ